jgi:hypothetical protein
MRRSEGFIRGGPDLPPNHVIRVHPDRVEETSELPALLDSPVYFDLSLRERLAAMGFTPCNIDLFHDLISGFARAVHYNSFVRCSTFAALRGAHENSGSGPPCSTLPPHVLARVIREHLELALHALTSGKLSPRTNLLGHDAVGSLEINADLRFRPASLSTLDLIPEVVREHLPEKALPILENGLCELIRWLSDKTYLSLSDIARHCLVVRERPRGNQHNYSSLDPAAILSTVQTSVELAIDRLFEADYQTGEALAAA